MVHSYRAALAVLAALVVLEVAMPCPRAHAEDRATRATAAPVIVDVILVANAALDPIFGRRIASWFDPRAFRIDVGGVARLDAERVLSPEPGPSAHVWVTLRGQGARLYFVGGARGEGAPAYLVRDIRLERGLDEMGAERVAEAIHFSVLALLEGRASSARADVVQALESDVSPPRDAPSSPDRSTVLGPDAASARNERRSDGTDRARADRRTTLRASEVGFGYAAAYRGDEGWAHGPRASLLVPLGRAFAIAGWVRAAFPATRTLGPVDFALYGATLSLDGALRIVASPGASLDIVAGPALEWVHYTPLRTREPGISVESAATEVRPAWTFGARATFEWPVRWTLWADATVAFTRTRYEISVSGAKRTIGQPWLASPALEVEVRF